MRISAAVWAVLTPDGDEAREWAERELADPAYDAAEPTLLDRIAGAVSDFFQNLFSGGVPGGWGPGLAILATIVVGALLVAALLIWGRPRSTARSRHDLVDPFGEPDGKTAARLREEAAAAADQGEWDAAIVLRFRALARGLTERAIVEPPPGATVHAFARDVVRAFPGTAGRVDAAADAFDDVRYLRRPGSPELYGTVAALDEDLVRTRPAMADTAVAGASA